MRLATLGAGFADIPTETPRLSRIGAVFMERQKDLTKQLAYAVSFDPDAVPEVQELRELGLAKCLTGIAEVPA